MKKKLWVIKIGGNVLDDALSLEIFLNAFSKIEGFKVLVHGGGKIATQLGSKLGIGHHMVNGRRVTDSQTLDLVTMVYGGLINKNLVAKLQSLGCNAIGLCGADANIFPAKKRLVVDVDFGFVGDIAVDLLQASRLQLFLDANLSMVIAPLTHDGHGHILNTNADTMASAIASLLAAEYDTELIYCFEKEGVLDNLGKVMVELHEQQFGKLVSEGTILAGMIPKLTNSFSALHSGVNKVRILQASALMDVINGSLVIGTRVFT